VAIILPKGTKEFLAVTVDDKLNNITTLEGETVTFDVRGEDDALVVTDGPTILQSMIALCLVDTTTWDEGKYRLFLKIDIAPQRPVLGPFKFDVEDYSND
jgi:hypothetical protein